MFNALAPQRLRPLVGPSSVPHHSLPAPSAPSGPVVGPSGVRTTASQPLRPLAGPWWARAVFRTTASLPRRPLAGPSRARAMFSATTLPGLLSPSRPLQGPTDVQRHSLPAPLMSDKRREAPTKTTVKCGVWSDTVLGQRMAMIVEGRRAATLLSLAEFGARMDFLIERRLLSNPALPNSAAADLIAVAPSGQKPASIASEQPEQSGRDGLVAMDFATRFLQLSGR